jgi:hypothetical protein
LHDNINIVIVQIKVNYFQVLAAKPLDFGGKNHRTEHHCMFQVASFMAFKAFLTQIQKKIVPWPSWNQRKQLLNM